MKNINIFCEGVTDQVFIADCLNIFYKVTIDKQVGKIKTKWNIKFSNEFYKGEVIETGGYSCLRDDTYMQMIINNIEGHNLVVFDADKEGHGSGSFINTQKRLTDLQKRKNISFNYYLWPNHQDDGTVENLIRQIVHKDKEPVIKCIERHQDCLKSTEIEGLKKSDNKDVIRYYLHTCMKESEGRNVDYKDTSIWNISPNNIIDLKRFKDFLDEYFL